MSKETMKETAVEWLLENLNSEPYSEEEFNYNSDCWDKALEMEKEQIEIAFFKGDLFAADYFDADNPTKDVGENYYNETFKKQEQ
jgi:hypothetical protein